MTNGEKIQEVFKTCVGEVGLGMKRSYIDGLMYLTNTSWWNAEYKEPTTENEAKYCDRNICLKNEYNNIGCEDCEVTKSQESTTKKNLAVDCIDKSTKCKHKCIDNDLGVDCISRADARRLICKIDRKYMFGMSGKVFRDLYNGIDDLPSVTPQEPNTGHWIRVDKDKLVCSECGVTHFIAQYPQGKIAWCPNCGSRNEVEE